MPTFDISPTEIRALPNYTILEAAHYLRISASTVKSWMLGRRYPTRQGQKRFSPLITPAQLRPTILLSFTNMVEAHVLHAIRHEHRIKLPKVRQALNYVRRTLNMLHPLINQKFQTDGIDLFIDHLGDLVVASEGGSVILRGLRDWFEVHLARIEYDENKIALRLYPFTRENHHGEQPKIIVIDPRISFGRPIINGSGVPTSAIYERYLAGDSPEHLAYDYDRDVKEIHEAIRCESR